MIPLAEPNTINQRVGCAARAFRFLIFFGLIALAIVWSGSSAHAATTAAASSPAAASTTANLTLGQIVCNAKNELRGYWGMIQGVVFIMGVYFLSLSLVYFKRTSEDPNRQLVGRPIAFLVASGLMMSFIPFAGAVQQSVFPGITGGGGSVATCTPGAVEDIATSGTLDKVMQNFVKNVHGPMIIFLSVIAWCVGIYYIARALWKSSRYGSDPKVGSPSHIFALLFTGAILISIGQFLPTMMQSLLGSSDLDNMNNFVGINWGVITGSSIDTTNIDNTVKAMLAFVQIIGLIAVVRGIIMFRNSIEGTAKATVMQGLIHVIAGSLAINIGTMLQVFNDTFGLDLINS